jgi:intracellular sulfur oxidation DsrE/DsrF family protein
MTNRFAETVVIFNDDGLGKADDVLRHKLAVNYLRTLIELEQYPLAILLYAEGVRLVASQSPCLAELTELASAGVPIIACRTCLDYSGLMDDVAVGEIGNMMRIVELQALAEKVITA